MSAARDKETVRYEDLLARDGTVITHIAGNSMEPLLHDRQSIVVVESADRVNPRKNDVVLFRKDGVYVLHRILTVQGHSFIICGDNAKVSDHIGREEILGVMTAYYRTPEGQKHLRGGLYDRTYCGLLPLIHWAGPCRAGIRRCFSFIHEVIRRKD